MFESFWFTSWLSEKYSLNQMCVKFSKQLLQSRNKITELDSYITQNYQNAGLNTLTHLFVAIFLAGHIPLLYYM